MSDQSKPNPNPNPKPGVVVMQPVIDTAGMSAAEILAAVGLPSSKGEAAAASAAASASAPSAAFTASGTNGVADGTAVDAATTEPAASLYDDHVVLLNTPTAPGLKPKKTYQVTLTTGRVITVQEPNGNVLMRAMTLIPQNISNNNALLSNIQALLYVRSYLTDEGTVVPIPVASTFDQIMELGDFLGDEGLMFLNMVLSELFPPSAAFSTALKRSMEQQRASQKVVRGL